MATALLVGHACTKNRNSRMIDELTGVIFFQPPAHLLLIHHAHHPPTFFLCTLLVQPHDQSTHAPHVIPGGVKQVPPTVGRRRRKRDTQLAHGQQDRRTHDRGHRIHRKRRRLQSTRVSPGPTTPTKPTHASLRYPHAVALASLFIRPSTRR